MEVDFSSLSATLTWVVLGGGAAVIANMFFAMLAENVSGWHGLPVPLKLILPLVFSVLIAVGAQATLEFLPGYIAMLEPWFKVAALAIMGYLSSQREYIRLKSSNYGAEYR